MPLEVKAIAEILGEGFIDRSLRGRPGLTIGLARSRRAARSPACAVAARPRVYVRPHGPAQGPERPRHRHPLHVARRDDRQGRASRAASAASSSARCGDGYDQQRGQLDSQRQSRVGKRPVLVPKGVEVKLDGRQRRQVKGPKGALERELPAERRASSKDGEDLIIVHRGRRAPASAAASFTACTRALVQNMVKGVADGLRASRSS